MVMFVAPVALYVLVMLAKVLLPEMVNVPAPPWLRVMFGQESPRLALKVFADAEVRLIAPVPVRLKELPVAPFTKAEPLELFVKVPEFIAKTFVKAPLMDTGPANVAL